MTQTLPATPTTDELDHLAERVDTAHTAVQALGDAERTKAMDLRQAIEAFHKAGLTTIVRRLKADPRGKELLIELASDPLVYALFSMHGIVRSDPTTRVRRVLDDVRPYMQSHGGDVELVEIRGDTVYVRLHGACNGCSMSAVTLREGVEEAILSQIAEIKRIEVLDNEPGPAIIGLNAISVQGKNVGWVKGPAVDAVHAGKIFRMDAAETSIIIINIQNRLSAYRNACAHQGNPLDGGLLDEDGTLTCPWHGFCYDASTGECLTVPQAQLESFPLRVEDGHIWVRPT